MDFKRHDAAPANQVRGVLDNMLHIMRVVVLAADDDHVLDAAAHVELAVMEKPDVARPEITLALLTLADDAGMKPFLCEAGVVPVSETLARPVHPYLADLPVLERDVCRRFNDPDD